MHARYLTNTFSIQEWSCSSYLKEHDLRKIDHRQRDVTKSFETEKSKKLYLVQYIPLYQVISSTFYLS